jgi:hypothetical protein
VLVTAAGIVIFYSSACLFTLYLYPEIAIDMFPEIPAAIILEFLLAKFSNPTTTIVHTGMEVAGQDLLIPDLTAPTGLNGPLPPTPVSPTGSEGSVGSADSVGSGSSNGSDTVKGLPAGTNAIQNMKASKFFSARGQTYFF